MGKFSLKKKATKKEKVYGLDIGESGVRIASISKSPEGMVLENLSFRDFPLHLEPVDNSTIIREIRALIDELEGNKKEVSAVVNLYGKEPFIKFLTLPYMSEEELNKTVNWQAQRFIVSDLDKMFVDYAILNTFEELGIKKINLIVAATTREAVLNQIGILKEGGVEPVAIELDCLARFYLAKEKGFFKQDEVVCFIDIGTKRTVIQIIDNGVPCFRRECLTIGSWEINKALINRLKINLEEAEIIKREFYLNSREESKAVIERFIKDTLIEIKRSLDYYIDLSPQKTVERVILSGGGALLNNLESHFRKYFGIEVEKINPFKDVIFSEKIKDTKFLQNNSLRFTTVMGLALEAVS